MAIAQLIDLSNYDSLLVQSTQSRAGTPDGNVFFDSANKKIEFITKQELATVDLSGGITTGAISIDADVSGTFTRSTGDFIADGFVAGRQFAASGYVAGGNNATFTILSVTTTVITVTDNTGMVTEAGDGDETIASVAEDNPLDEVLGLKLEAAYVFENQERRTDEALRAFDKMIKGNFKFAGAYTFEKSNKPSTIADRNILRGSGWTEYATDGGVDRIFYGNQGLSNIETGSQPYNQLSSSALPDLNTITPVNYAKTGQVSEAVQSYGSTANTPSDAGAYVGSVATAADQTITVDKETGTFTRVAGDFLTDGFEPGHRFIPTGLALNTGIYTIDTVTDTVITIKLAEWDTLTDETGDGDEVLTVNGFDTRAYQAVSIRTYGQNYDRKETTTDLGISELGGYLTGFAVNESVHLTTGDYALADVYTAPIAPWTGMTLEKLAVPQVEGGFNEADGSFSWVLNNTGNGTLYQCVAFLDALSQDDVDIDSGAESVTYGKRVGTWYYYNATGQVVTRSGADDLGLFIEQLPVADEQNVVFTDDAGDLKTRPFSVSVEGTIGSVAKSDVLAWYHNYFAALYNSAGAVTVLDSTATPVKGLASSADVDNKIIYAFDYDGDTVGGGSGTDKDCVFLCEGDGGATQAKTLFTITRITTVAFACIPAVENNA